jgi:hypothetical protein
MKEEIVLQRNEHDKRLKEALDKLKEDVIL